VPGLNWQIRRIPAKKVAPNFGQPLQIKGGDVARPGCIVRAQVIKPAQESVDDSREGHQRGTRVYSLPGHTDAPAFATQPRVALENGDVVPGSSQQCGRRQPAESRPDDNNASSCHG
jgi:hypothetical protein